MKHKNYNPYSPYQQLGKIYFWTATIHKWKNLLYFPEQKEMIINSLQHLHDRGLVSVYAFVIMPNHIHIIWRQNKLNGKEMPKSSFMKHTARQLMRKINDYGKNHLFKVYASNKEHQIWKPNSLAIELYSKRFIKQKLNYIHKAPVSAKWKISNLETEYPYSSALFYLDGKNGPPFLKNILDLTESPVQKNQKL